MKDTKLLLRIALSPLMFVYGGFLTFIGMLFPLPLLSGFSFIGLCAEPFIWLFNKGGSNIESMDACLQITKNNTMNLFLCAILPLWMAFGVTYLYIKDGEIINL